MPKQFKTIMIISRSKGIKIQIDIRHDRAIDDKVIAVISTVLSADEHKINTRNDKEIYVD